MSNAQKRAEARKTVPGAPAPGMHERGPRAYRRSVLGIKKPDHALLAELDANGKIVLRPSTRSIKRVSAGRTRTSLRHDHAGHAHA